MSIPITVTLHRADLTQLKSRQCFSSLRYIPSLISARSLYKNSAIEKFLEPRGQLSEKLAIIASTLFHAQLLLFAHTGIPKESPKGRNPGEEGREKLEYSRNMHALSLFGDFILDARGKKENFVLPSLVDRFLDRTVLVHQNRMWHLHIASASHMRAREYAMALARWPTYNS